MSEPIGCVCVCVWIDKTVCCPCAWGVCQCVLVLREHAQWDKCRCGSYAQVLHDCWLADVRCTALKSVPPSPLFFYCYFQDSVGIHREEWQASLHMVLAIG